MYVISARGASGHRRDAGDLSTFAVNPFELLRELVERHVEDPVAAGVAGDPTNVVGAVGGDLHAIRKALLACADPQASWCIL